jgi:hypothetical protein
MRKVLLFFCLILGYNVNAQNFDDLMRINKQLDCGDISYNSALLFEKYFSNNQIDSAKNILTYWENKCGRREPLHRAKLLLALKENEYHDSLLTKNILSYIFNYQNRMNMIKYDSYYDYDEYKPYYGFIPAGQEYDMFTIKEFGHLKSMYETNTIEYLLCEFYSDNYDILFTKLQTNDYKTSTLSEEYNKALQKCVNMSEMHLSLITGVWIPTGKLNLLGVHPELGFQWGLKHKKMSYDIVMAFKFLNSPNEYFARRKETNELEPTRHFFGGYIGIEVGRDIYTSRKHELQLVGGVAFDGFDALNENKDLNLKSSSTSSYNFNMGLAYRYYLSSSQYVGLRAKYNIVNYTLNNTVDLTGNAITIQFTYGGLWNQIKQNNLKVLKYKYNH